MKYRKKPVVIDAVKFTEEVALKCLEEGFRIFDKLGASGSWHPGERKLHRVYIPIETLEGTMQAELGDWIIKGVAGELYPCKPEIFEATYEAVL